MLRRIACVILPYELVDSLVEAGRALAPSRLYGLGERFCEDWVLTIGSLVLDKFHLTPTERDFYFSFLRRVALIYRTKFGRDLCQCLARSYAWYVKNGAQAHILTLLLLALMNRLRPAGDL